MQIERSVPKEKQNADCENISQTKMNPLNLRTQFLFCGCWCRFIIRYFGLFSFGNV